MEVLSRCKWRQSQLKARKALQGEDDSLESLGGAVELLLAVQKLAEIEGGHLESY
jgi:hypothetical protein